MMARRPPIRCTALLVALSVAGVSARGAGDDLSTIRTRLMRPSEARPATPITNDGLEGRVLCGYQGWFCAEGDGAGLGWRHWRIPDAVAPGGSRVAFDLLPDVAELGADERFPTDLAWPDGQPVEVFSAHRRQTVVRHFRWMRDYGIDGVFVQRFAVGLRNPRLLAHHTQVLAHCRDGALEHGRVYAVMYDLSGLPAGRVGDVLDDWRQLRGAMRIGDDPASLRLEGRPLVAVWGIGFADDRAYSLAECKSLVAALVADGCAVMIGVPTGWRTGDRDALGDPGLTEIAAESHVVSPWTVGRYQTPDDVSRHADRDWSADMAWCRERGITYLPVVFPGFSWHNLKGGTLGQTPRLGGRFFQRQLDEAMRVGAECLYVAMFDEVDEATAIFKCVEPLGRLAERFVGLDGVPGDHYLRLTGAAGEQLRQRFAPAGQSEQSATPR